MTYLIPDEDNGRMECFLKNLLTSINQIMNIAVLTISLQVVIYRIEMPRLFGAFLRL
jgi:hypothetical protein